MSVYWYSYKHLVRASHEVALPGLDVWCGIYNVFVEVLADRTGQFRGPVSVIADPGLSLPDAHGRAAKPFEQCAFERSEELLTLAERTGKPLYLLFSGGIDSTTVAVAFLKHHGEERLRERLKIVTSTEAWAENPSFVRTHLSGKYEFLPLASLERYCDGRAIIVTGEMNDYYVPNSQYKRLRDAGGIVPSYSADALFSYLRDSGMADAHARRWRDVLDASWSASPVRSDSFETFLWWTRFVWTRQGFKFLPFATVDLARAGVRSLATFDERVQHFFNTEDFQRWGMENADRSPRKNHCRALIGSYFDDPHWLERKQKYSSLGGTFALRDIPYGFDATFTPLRSRDELLAHFDAQNDFRVS